MTFLFFNVQRGLVPRMVEYLLSNLVQLAEQVHAVCIARQFSHRNMYHLCVSFCSAYSVSPLWLKRLSDAQDEGTSCKVACSYLEIYNEVSHPFQNEQLACVMFAEPFNRKSSQHMFIVLICSAGQPVLLPYPPANAAHHGPPAAGRGQEPEHQGAPEAGTLCGGPVRATGQLK